MDLTLVYVTIALGFAGIVVQRSKALTILIYFFAWTLMWTKYTADYHAYETIYYSSFEFRDGGFHVMCTAGKLMGLTFFEFFMSIGAIAIGLYCYFTLRYAQKCSFVAALWLLFISLFDLVQFRNFLAFAIVLIFIPCLFQPTRNKIIIYCAGVILATTIHLTSAFYLIFIFMNKQWFSAKNLRKIIVPLILLAVALLIGIDYYAGRAETMMSLYNRKTSDLTKWMTGILLVGNVLYVKLWSDRKLELKLTESEGNLASPTGKAIVMMNLSLILLFPISLQSMTIMRLYKYMAIVNFAFISNHMSGYTNWRLVPQTFANLLYSSTYLILFLFLHSTMFLKTVAKPIFLTNIFWPTIASYF